MNSYDIQVELGINSSKFEYVYDENEGRRVITQTKHLPNVVGIYGDEYEYDVNDDNYVKKGKINE